MFGQINVLPIKKDKARQATGDSRPHVVTAYRPDEVLTVDQQLSTLVTYY